MTTPLASGRHVAGPGDTVNGNLKVVEFGLFGGSTCASPTTGASASAAVNIAVASFMENLLLLRMYGTPDAVLPLARAGACIYYSEQVHCHLLRAVCFRNC